MMRAMLAAFVFLALNFGAAEAGAWTLDRGAVQILSGITSSRASDRFDDRGARGAKVFFSKLLAQTTMEYGLTDAVTVYALPEFVSAESGGHLRDISHYRSLSAELGARVLLLSHVGMFSVQISGRSAGAFDMSVSASGQAGAQVELRALYGRSFKVLGRDCFVDLEAAERWIRKPRPDELTIDVTAGIWLTRSNMVLLQNFNIASISDAKPPYAAYRLHKLQLSLVQRLSRRWSVQGGYFFAPAGRNMVREQGFMTQIWYRN